MSRRAIPSDATGASATVALSSGEVLFDKLRNTLRAGNGIKPGGYPIAKQDDLPARSLIAKLPWQRQDDVLSGNLPASFDATEYLQEALDDFAGQTITLPLGILHIRKTMFVSSGTSLRLENSRLIANYANWIPSGIVDFLYGQPGIDDDTGIFLINQNYQASALTDHDIEIIGGNYIRGVGEKSGHAILMRRVRRVHIERIYAEYGGNATAMLACMDTNVVNSSSYNTYNAGFDHWDGAGFANVDNLLVVCDHGDTQQGVQFTGQPTNPATGADSAVITGSNIRCKGIHNTAAQQASAFIVNALNDASSVKTGNFTSIVIDGCDNGIALQGDVQGIRIDAVVRGATNQPVTLTVNSITEPEAPSGNVVDVTLIDCAAQYALVGINGTDNVVRFETAGTNTAIVGVQFFSLANGNRVQGEEGLTWADISAAKTNQFLIPGVGRQAGYGTPTNGARISGFDASAITHADLAKVVAQLITDLISGRMPKA